MLISSRDEVYQKLLFITVALLLSSLELTLPRIPALPWLKPGLANIVTITWLMRYGYRDTILYGFLRIWLTVFFFGFSFFSASLAFGGMITAVSAMAILVKVNAKKPLFGFVGIGVVGAFMHNIGQLSLLNILIGEASLVGIQLPLMSMISLATGSFTGIFAYHFNKVSVTDKKVALTCVEMKSISTVKRLLSIALFAVMIAVLMIKTIPLAAVFAVTALIVSVPLSKTVGELFNSIRRFWVFLLILFITTGLTTDWNQAIVQLLRVFGWLQCSTIFRYLKSDRLLFSLLYRFFPKREGTLAAALLAVEVFPEMIKDGVFKILAHPKELFRNPAGYLEQLVSISHSVIDKWNWERDDESIAIRSELTEE